MVTSETLTPTAKKFMAEHELHSWLEQQNLAKGLAVPSCALWQKRLESGKGKIKANGSRATRTQWIGRFKRRWNVGMGKVSIRETLTPTEYARKVVGCLTIAESMNRDAQLLIRVKQQKKRGAIWWPQIWGRALESLHARDQKTAPIFLIRRLATISRLPHVGNGRTLHTMPENRNTLLG
jgi:hypothetical protein